jgi:hypothetical protein
VSRSACNPARELRQGQDFFIWIRRNPLKSLDSTKGIQGNEAIFLGFPWIHLDFLGGNSRPG